MTIAPLALLALSAAAGAIQDGGIMGPYPGVQILEGPTLVCGEAFALRLAAGERALYQEGVDFQVFNVEAADGGFTLYEGNYPQPHDDEIRTGLPFPAVVAIHDGRSEAARARGAVRARLLTGSERNEACQQRNRR